MCVLALAWKAHPRWLLVAAANRDERHDRPAAPLARWADAPDIIAGRDLASGGTWLGVSTAGRLAAVTNLRSLAAPDPALASRGALVTGLLSGEPVGPVEGLAGFNPFNAVTADGACLQFLSNRPEPLRRALAPGIYGMSNGPLDEPWPKTLRLKDRLAGWMAEGGDAPALLDDLRDDARAPGESPHASIFVIDPAYGTRCSTVVAIDADGQGTITERRYTPGGHPAGEVSLSFDWPG